MVQNESHCTSFSRLGELPQPRWSANDRGSDEGYIQPKGVHNIIYALVVDGLATYHDIQYVLTLDEILDLFEILIVKSENEAYYRKSKEA